MDNVIIHRSRFQELEWRSIHLCIIRIAALYIYSQIFFSGPLKPFHWYLVTFILEPMTFENVTFEELCSRASWCFWQEVVLKIVINDNLKGQISSLQKS
jgi:hypothetical protein